MSKEALRACAGEPGKIGPSVVVDDRVAKVLSSPEIISTECIVDGTFPDWRRVVPVVPCEWRPPECYSTNLLAALSKIGTELNRIGERYPSNGTPMRVLSPSDMDPALVFWPSVPNAFGILMPTRANVKTVDLPGWFAAPRHET